MTDRTKEMRGPAAERLPSLVVLSSGGALLGADLAAFGAALAGWPLPDRMAPLVAIAAGAATFAALVWLSRPRAGGTG